MPIDMTTNDRLKELAVAQRDAMVAFCQRLIRTPSMSGEEEAVARLVAREMEQLAYDNVWIDEVGNVIGLVRGSGDGSRLQFNAHMDHVDAGDPADWPYPPYGGEIHQGAIWGRGTADLKGPLAVQVHAIGALKASGLQLPKGDIYVVGVVYEEMGGLGTRHLARTLPCDYAVISEATGNQIMRGHRGRTELVARFRGRSAHAGVPELSVNPHYSAAAFLAAVQRLDMPEDPFLGQATLAPTLYHTDQGSANVVPSMVDLHLDCRQVPAEDAGALIRRLETLLEASLQPGCQATLSPIDKTGITWTGQQHTWPLVAPSFVLDAKHPLVTTAQAALEGLYGREVSVGHWFFATDGGRLMQTGVPCIGFAPGDARLVHTVQEHICIEEMVEGMAGCMALALTLGELK